MARDALAEGDLAQTLQKLSQESRKSRERRGRQQQEPREQQSRELREPRELQKPRGLQEPELKDCQLPDITLDALPDLIPRVDSGALAAAPMDVVVSAGATCGWHIAPDALGTAVPWTCPPNNACATATAERIVACVPAATLQDEAFTTTAPAADFYSECRAYPQSQWSSCTALPPGVGCCTAADLPACGLVVWADDPGRSMFRCYDAPTTVTLAATPPVGAFLPEDVVTETAVETSTTMTTTTLTSQTPSGATPSAGPKNSAPASGQDAQDAAADAGIAGESAGGGGGSNGRRTAAIVGGTIGGVVFAALVGFAIAFFFIRRRKQRQAAAGGGEMGGGGEGEGDTTANNSPNPQDTQSPEGWPTSSREIKPTTDIPSSSPPLDMPKRPSSRFEGLNLPYPTVALVPASQTTLAGSTASSRNNYNTANLSGAFSMHSESSYRSASDLDLALAATRPSRASRTSSASDGSSGSSIIPGTGAGPDVNGYEQAVQMMQSMMQHQRGESLTLSLDSAPSTDDLGALATRVANRYQESGDLGV